MYYSFDPKKQIKQIVISHTYFARYELVGRGITQWAAMLGPATTVNGAPTLSCSYLSICMIPKTHAKVKLNQYHTDYQDHLHTHHIHSRLVTQTIDT